MSYGLLYVNNKGADQLAYLRSRAAYWFTFFIQNRYLRFDRYTELNVRVSNKISNLSREGLKGFLLHKICCFRHKFRVIKAS